MRPDFQLSRESLKVLLNLLNQDRRHGWGATIEVLVFLFWLASGASYRVVSRVFAIPRSTVHRIVHRVTEEVVAICHQVIHLPRTPEDLDIVSWAVCDHLGCFIDTLWAGRGQFMTPGCYATAHCTDRPFTLLQGISSLQMAGTHVSTIYSPSSLPTRGQSVVWEPSASTLIIPKARSIIVCAFGMMKTRFWAIFLQALEVHHTFVPHITCAVLHNICLGAGDVVAPEDEPEDDVKDDGGTGLEAVSGALWWDQLSAEVSALEEVPLDHDYC
ncbi:unnamed protein product [Oreochromis niloticus]|nr:unnamed protein product [Mustela putorius furo]